VSYHTEAYWDDVAKHIREREGSNLIAGDDEPYYRYKRSLFLQLFSGLQVRDRSVLEIGSGPGGNLLQLKQMGCKKVAGADISSNMIALAQRSLGEHAIIRKTDGVSLPFENRSYDLVFTSTVLQHNTDEGKLILLIKDMARVAKEEIVLFERIEKTVRGHESNLGRPVSYYANLLNSCGFKLEETRFLPIQASYYTCGAIRKLFNSKSRKEGEPLSPFSILLEKVTLPVTRVLDRLIPSNRDLGMLRFTRKA
jgi:ubiquinone/menaquinone biosynthesis C-methylase UbiE